MHTLQVKPSDTLWRRFLGLVRPDRAVQANAERCDANSADPVRLRNLREISFKELLQREEAQVNMEEARRIAAGRSVLISGAGGSIGSELARQVARANPSKLVLLDKSENSLFYVHLEARELLGPARAKPVLADLLRREPLREIFASHRPEIVFHAAAHKHVSLLESHPHEAIRNNVLGTRNIAQAAIECGAAIFVNISTDKAVEPASYMGLSKKITELCIQELAREFGIRFCNVRFGNVAGSTGSVVRLFLDQIEKGGPVRVSHPRATRYFMSAREAAHLILRAAALAEGGETFLREMGEPVNILGIAQRTAAFAGLQLGRDLRLEFTGLKEGEKLAEQLCESWEEPSATAAEGIFAIRDQDPLAAGVLRHIDHMEALLARDDREALRAYLWRLFPEFKRAARQVLEMPRKPPVAADERASVHAL